MDMKLLNRIHVLCAVFTGGIYISTVDKDGVMDFNKKDVTKEAIGAVAAHMQFKAEEGKSKTCYYETDEGTLTWTSK